MAAGLNHQRVLMAFMDLGRQDAFHRDQVEGVMTGQGFGPADRDGLESSL